MNKKPVKPKKPTKPIKPKVLVAMGSAKIPPKNVALPKQPVVQKRPAAKRPKKVNPIQTNYTLAHMRNTLHKQPITRNKLMPGDVVTFYYRGKYSTHPRPMVLILNKRYKGKTHGLALRHISERQLSKLMLIVLRSTHRIELMGSNDLPYKIPIEKRNPRAFYYSKVKPFMKGVKTNPYRTYVFNSLRMPLLCDYKFKFIKDKDWRRRG